MICDEQLVLRALQGNDDAFCQLVERYKAYIFAIILNFIKDHFEAENVAQETFLQIYRSLPQYRQENFKAWVGKIATNKALDWRRTQSCLQKSSQGGTRCLTTLAVENATPEDIFLHNEEIQHLRSTCRRLPNIYQTSIHKFYQEGKSQQEIALEEGISVKTVESRLYRARQLIREKWKGEEHESL